MLGPVYFDSLKLVGLYTINQTEQKCIDLNKIPLTECDCPIGCEKTKFSFDQSNSKFDLTNGDTLFNIYYDEMEETVMSEEPKIEVAQLI